MIKKSNTPVLKKFKVYVSQINQTMVEVYAENEDQARESGYKKWKREYAHSNVTAVEEVKE